VNLGLYCEARLNGAGGIAQLGERLHGMQEVSGSIPLTSTKQKWSRVERKVNAGSQQQGGAQFKRE
jgi:hypothetical protein